MEETHGIAMRTKVAVSFANIFMSAVETEIINKSKIKPLEWKRYIDDVFSLWDTTREEIDQFILVANRHHPTIHFTAEISEAKTNFLDTTIFKEMLREIYREPPFISYKQKEIFENSKHHFSSHAG